MPTELTADTLIPLSIEERKTLILDQASSIDVINIIDEDLRNAYKRGKVIASIASAYFQSQIDRDNQNGSDRKLEAQSNLICSKTDEFADDFIEWLKQDFARKNAILEHHPNPSNLFELCGAKLLATSNSVTRTLSTKMGLLWEEISDISPYVIRPEVEFGIKITGVDIVILTEGIVKFAQLKTLKGTLTGSQAPRAKQELGMHQNSVFIAAFDLGQWTFPITPDIPRIAGKEFWDTIHIDYDSLENHVRNMLQKVDRAFAELAAS